MHNFKYIADEFNRKIYFSSTNFSHKTFSNYLNISPTHAGFVSLRDGIENLFGSSTSLNLKSSNSNKELSKEPFYVCLFDSSRETYYSIVLTQSKELFEKVIKPKFQDATFKGLNLEYLNYVDNYDSNITTLGLNLPEVSKLVLNELFSLDSDYRIISVENNNSPKI